jgi:hypothetical protein
VHIHVLDQICASVRMHVQMHSIEGQSDVGPVAGDQTLHGDGDGDGDEVCGDRTESQALITRDPVAGKVQRWPARRGS